MATLFLGLALFFALHMIPYFARRPRATVIEKVGIWPYKGLFAAASLGSFVLIVLGWQQADISLFYNPPMWGRHVTYFLVLLGFILFIASNAPSNIRRMVRHPQLTGVLLWGIGHLFANGENRSVLLFGGLVLFSLVAMWASNRRDGEWVKRDKVPIIGDIVTLVIAGVLYIAFLMYHGTIIGVPVMPA